MSKGKILRLMVLLGAFALGEALTVLAIYQQLGFEPLNQVASRDVSRYVFALWVATGLIVTPILSVLWADRLMKRYRWPNRD